MTKEDLFEANVSRLVAHLRANEEILTSLDPSMDDILSSIEWYFDNK